MPNNNNNKAKQNKTKHKRTIITQVVPTPYHFIPIHKARGVIGLSTQGNT